MSELLCNKGSLPEDVFSLSYYRQVYGTQYVTLERMIDTMPVVLPSVLDVYVRDLGSGSENCLPVREARPR